MKFIQALLIPALISIAMCSCTKEEIIVVGDYVSPVGETKIELAELPVGKVYGYLENQNGEEFMAEFLVPDTLIAGIAEALHNGEEVLIKYLSIDQSYVEDESGMFSEEHDIVLAEGNLEVSNFKVIE
ncbi:hypothetical protein IPJ63_00920 [Candidatus Nomurabacteria bacterium]|nr:MAG: hypothetical protein IPJ63_00920 [Candidatus Nomurabacteria bacterium]